MLLKSNIDMASDTYFEYFTVQEQRTKRSPLRRGEGQVLIQVQLMYTLQFCDYEEEKK